MLVVTTEKVVGHRVTEMKGQCFGVVVRSRGLGGNIMAGLRSIVGGEIDEYTQLVEEARRHAVDRLVRNATAMGANAVLMMRFDSAEIGQTMSEIVAARRPSSSAKVREPVGAAGCFICPIRDPVGRGGVVDDRRLQPWHGLASRCPRIRFIARTRCRTLAVQAGDWPSTRGRLGSDQRALCRSGERQIGHCVLSTGDGRTALCLRVTEEFLG
jgi:uncharacterized protein YbjQ (UPF0145 family)